MGLKPVKMGSDLYAIFQYDGVGWRATSFPYYKTVAGAQRKIAKLERDSRAIQDGTFKVPRI